MLDREKVINKLYDMQFVCAVYGDDEFIQIIKDALALLREQEARVMTLEEVKSLRDETDVWLEEIECIVVAVTISKQGEIWGVENTTFFYGIDGNSYNDGSNYEDADYGIYWRCWTSRPTDEQREAVKWNEQ